MAAPYPYKTTPYPHQREALLASARKPAFSLLMDPGTGKSKITLDNAGYLALKGVINGLVIIAPNGVHQAWVTDELPRHMSESVSYMAHVYRAATAATAGATSLLNALVRDDCDLSVLSINIDALRTPEGFAAISAMLRARRCMLVVDEAVDIANPGAERTRRLQKLAPLAKVRRILDGTMGADRPFEWFAPYRFLDPRIIGARNFTAFKTEYAEWIDCERGNGQRFRIQRKDRTGAPVYKNLDKLKAKVAPYTYRASIDALNLPPEILSTLYYDLTPEQRGAYMALLRDKEFTFASDGATTTTPLVITQLLRLQQIVSGYLPVDAVYNEETDEMDPQPTRRIPGRDPRLELLLEDSARTFGADRPFIVWSRFTEDVNRIVAAFADAGRRVVRYDGQVSTDERAEAVRRFQAGDAQVLVGKQQSGGRGLTLTAARGMYFYSNLLSLKMRLQTMARVRRATLQHSVLVRDLCATYTIDEKIARDFSLKRNVWDFLSDLPKGMWT